MQSEFVVRCDELYCERLLEFRKYVLEMFSNLEHNGVLKELQGCPQLDSLRMRKIEEIVKEALEGQKERQVQMLVEVNSQQHLTIQRLQTQLLQSSSISSQQKQLDRVREECQTRLEQQQKRHAMEMELAEHYFQELLRCSLSNYGRDSARTSENCCSCEGRAAHNSQVQVAQPSIESLVIPLESRCSHNQLLQQKCSACAGSSLNRSPVEQLTSTDSDTGTLRRKGNIKLHSLQRRKQLSDKLYQQSQKYSEKQELLRAMHSKSHCRTSKHRNTTINNEQQVVNDAFGLIRRNFERDLHRLKKALKKNEATPRKIPRTD